MFWGLVHLERGGMLLHEGVGINCEKGETTEVKVQEPSIWAKECMVGDCVSVIGLAYPSLMEGKCHGTLLLLVCICISLV